MNLKYMDMALKEAVKGYENGEIPVGAVIVKDGKVISKAHNLKEKNKCAVEHAEILAIKKASKKLKNWRLENCDMYVTLEPCPMCASAIKQSRISNVYSALSNSDEKNLSIISEIFWSDKINGNVQFYNDLYVEKSKEMLQKFFVERRKK